MSSGPRNLHVRLINRYYEYNGRYKQINCGMYEVNVYICFIYLVCFFVFFLFQWKQCETQLMAGMVKINFLLLFTIPFGFFWYYLNV